MERTEDKLKGEARYCECGHKYKVVTKEVHKYLEFIPAQFICKVEVVWVYSCLECSKIIQVTGYFAHARRRFDKCLTALKKTLSEKELKASVAYEGIKIIGESYKIEEQIHDLDIDERYKVRQKESKPLLDVYFAWLHSMNDGMLDSKSLIGDAIFIFDMPRTIFA